MATDKVIDIIEERLKRGLGQPTIGAQGGGSGGGRDDTDLIEMSEVTNRLSKLEGSYDSLKVVRPMTIAVLSLVLAVMVFGFAFLGTQMVSLSAQIARLDSKLDANVARLDGKIDANAARVNEKLDALPRQLAEEFRAMRAEMSAQTSAIAGSITAARQAPPQVLLVPAPTVQPPTQKP